MTQRITVIPGDGIGPEVTAAAQAVVEATGIAVEWRTAPAGEEVFHLTGEALPPATLDAIREDGVAIKGPTSTPSSTGFRSVNVRMRQALDLYANFRPAITTPGVKSRYENVDLMVIRENTEGLYSGLEHEVVPGVVESLRVITEKGSERVVRFAFEAACKYGRKKVTAVHKANILKKSDGLFLEVARRVAANYPQIAYDECIVDAAAMKLVLDPHQFDVLVMENLFGDILSDLCAGLVGGLGMAPSANVGDQLAVFEAVHGSAPDIAGKGIANPTALILSAALMLRFLGHQPQADRIEQAVRAALLDGRVCTGDLGGTATTSEYTASLIERMQG